MSGAGKVVCVTGASGYIASWLVKFLLGRGYTVKGTVRNLSDPSKVLHLKALEGAEERLHLFQANLIEDGSFDSVVDGCEGVFHTASPAFLSVPDPQDLTSGKMIGDAKQDGGLYLFNNGSTCGRQDQQTCFNSISMSSDRTIMLWHYRLGHPNFQYLKHYCPSYS